MAGSGSNTNEFFINQRFIDENFEEIDENEIKFIEQQSQFHIQNDRFAPKNDNNFMMNSNLQNKDGDLITEVLQMNPEHG